MNGQVQPIWARIQGFSYWPARLCSSIERLDLATATPPKGDDKVAIVFFGRSRQSGWIKASAVVPFTAATLPNKPTKAVSPDQDTPYFGSRLYKKDKDYRAAVLEAVRLGIANGDPFPHEIVDMVANADEDTEWDREDLCAECHGSELSGVSLICEKCESAETHFHCLKPPILVPPKNEWFCRDCCKANRVDFNKQITDSEEMQLRKKAESSKSKKKKTSKPVEIATADSLPREPDVPPGKPKIKRVRINADGQEVIVFDGRGRPPNKREPEEQAVGKKKSPRKEQAGSSRELLSPSLQQLLSQSSDSAAAQTPPSKTDDEQDDDICFVCKDSGKLILCDFNHCRRAYHQVCVLKTLNRSPEASFEQQSFGWPEEPWFCPVHHCAVCKAVEEDTRGEEIDPSNLPSELLKQWSANPTGYQRKVLRGCSSCPQSLCVDCDAAIQQVSRGSGVRSKRVSDSIALCTNCLAPSPMLKLARILERSVIRCLRSKLSLPFCRPLLPCISSEGTSDSFVDGSSSHYTDAVPFLLSQPLPTQIINSFIPEFWSDQRKVDISTGNHRNCEDLLGLLESVRNFQFESVEEFLLAFNGIIHNIYYGVQLHSSTENRESDSYLKSPIIAAANAVIVLCISYLFTQREEIQTVQQKLQVQALKPVAKPCDFNDQQSLIAAISAISSSKVQDSGGLKAVALSSSSSSTGTFCIDVSSSSTSDSFEDGHSSSSPSRSSARGRKGQPSDPPRSQSHLSVSQRLWRAECERSIHSKDRLDNPGYWVLPKTWLGWEACIEHGMAPENLSPSQRPQALNSRSDRRVTDATDTDDPEDEDGLCFGSGNWSSETKAQFISKWIQDQQAKTEDLITREDAGTVLLKLASHNPQGSSQGAANLLGESVSLLERGTIMFPGEDPREMAGAWAHGLQSASGRSSSKLSNSSESCESYLIKDETLLMLDRIKDMTMRTLHLETRLRQEYVDSKKAVFEYGSCPVSVGEAHIIQELKMANDQLRWTVRQQKDALAAAMARIEVLTAALSDTSSRVETETEAEADPESDNEMLAADV